MTYRSLLVYLDPDSQPNRCTQVALSLARAFDAHLVGLAPTGEIALPVTIGGEAALGQLGEMAWEALRRSAQQCAQGFRESCIAAHAVSFEALVDEADKAASLVRHAHAADLCVVGQADPALPGHRYAQALVEQVVLYGARPTLVVPYTGPASTLGERALVAWDDSREAARAAADALPLLRQARQVHLLAFSGARQPDEPALHKSAERLRGWLLRHGVGCEVHVEATAIGVGDALLSRAADLDSDLIVMGAYGHARFSEVVLGGATRKLLQSMTVPVLMSH